MVRFEHIEALYLLLVIPVLLLIFILQRIKTRNKIKKFGDIQLVHQLIRNRPRYKQQIKFALFATGLAFIITGLANLQFGSRKEKVKREGTDVVIAIDVSRSMLAEDIKPNRLESAKQMVYDLLGRLQNDRVGIIVFAGKAYVQMPITVDFGAAKLFLSSLNTEMIPAQGTAIGEAIDMSLQLFGEGEKKFRNLIIISDGENHEEGALESAKKAVKEGVVIQTVCVGTISGAPIPIYRNNQQIDYQRDKDNSIVLSKANESILNEIARAGNGKSFRLSNNMDVIDDLAKNIAQSEKKEYEGYVYTEFDSKYQYFIFLGLLFIVVEFFIFESKSKWRLNFSNLKLTRNVE
jgi:Ca-activated chloride channel homolog